MGQGIEFVRKLAKRRGRGTHGAKSQLLPMLEQVAIIILVRVRMAATEPVGILSTSRMRSSDTVCRSAPPGYPRKAL